jgi:hypothetical protein
MEIETLIRQSSMENSAPARIVDDEEEMMED